MHRFILGILLFFSGWTHASPLFESAETLELRLDGPLERLFENPQDETEQGFLLTAGDATYDVRVRVRGNSRKRVCDFTPLRLRFQKKQTNGTVFEELGKLKLITHCLNHDRGEKDLLEEYTAYRIFNLLSPASLRVRLLKIAYRDASGFEQDRYAVALEPVKMMARRLGLEEAEHESLSRSWLDAEQAAMVYVFQYLIGNTDWSLVTADGDDTCCHNGILLEDNNGDLTLVPYDFDLSGLVDARYAKPDPSLRIDSVTVRRYRGYCTSREALSKAVDRIVSHADDIQSLVRDLPLLSEKDKRRKIEYLSRFFKQAADKERMLANFERRCL